METTAIPLMRNDGKVVGVVRGNVFHKRVRGSVHMLRRPPGWAVDITVLADAEKHGAESVEIEDTETGKRYKVSVSLFWNRGIKIDRGHGRQIALPLKYWSVEGQPAQMSLLEGIG